MSPTPPPSTSTRMRVARASTAFSRSSLATLAGRSTTSPAAIWLARSSGRRWINPIGATPCEAPAKEPTSRLWLARAFRRPREKGAYPRARQGDETHRQDGQLQPESATIRPPIDDPKIGQLGRRPAARGRKGHPLGNCVDGHRAHGSAHHVVERQKQRVYDDRLQRELARLGPPEQREPRSERQQCPEQKLPYRERGHRFAKLEYGIDERLLALGELHVADPVHAHADGFRTVQHFDRLASFGGPEHAHHPHEHERYDEVEWTFRTAARRRNRNGSGPSHDAGLYHVERR